MELFYVWSKFAVIVVRTQDVLKCHTCVYGISCTHFLVTIFHTIANSWVPYMIQHFLGYAVSSHRATNFLNMMRNEDFSVIAQIMWSTKFVFNITYLSQLMSPQLYTHPNVSYKPTWTLSGKQASCTLCFLANTLPCNAFYSRNVWQEPYTVQTAYLSSGYQSVITLCLQHLMQIYLQL